jgi:hypothetical protein
MTPDDAQKVLTLAEICDFFVKQHALHVKFAQAAQERFENVEAALRLCAGLLEMPDVPQKKPLVEQFLHLIERTRDSELSREIFDALARTESDHEKIEAMLKSLRDSLSGDAVA